MSYPNAYTIWQNALTTSGFTQRDQSTKRLLYHPHTLRKFFRTRLGSVIPRDYVECLMGHEGYLASAYVRPDLEALIREYKAGMYVVSVFGLAEGLHQLKAALDSVELARQHDKDTFGQAIQLIKHAVTEDTTQLGHLTTENQRLRQELDRLKQVLGLQQNVLDMIHQADRDLAEELARKAKSPSS